MKVREFFNNIANKWDEIAKHDENKLKKIIHLSKVKPNSKILDVGTGTGILLKYLLETNPQKITAIDISENMIEKAKEKFDDKRLEFIVSDIFDFNQKGYDYIFLYSVYPHIQNKELLFKHLSYLLNSNGKVIIAHSESKEKINEIHKQNPIFEKDHLPPVEITENIMKKYFEIDEKIDDQDMYYISGIKK